MFDVKAYKAKWAKENRESRKRSWTKYNRSNKRRKTQKKYYESHKEFCHQKAIEWQRRNRKRVNELARIRNNTPEGKLRRRLYEKRYYKKCRIKRLAKDAVHNAIRAGKLVRKPCTICGKKSEGHHPDYNKPLEVVWLCRKHHASIHYTK